MPEAKAEFSSGNPETRFLSWFDKPCERRFGADHHCGPRTSIVKHKTMVLRKSRKRLTCWTAGRHGRCKVFASTERHEEFGPGGEDQQQNLRVYFGGS